MGFYKRERARLLSTHACTYMTIWGYREKGAFCRPGRAPTRNQTGWHLNLELHIQQDSEKINFCCLSLPYTWYFVWQPEQTNILCNKYVIFPAFLFFLHSYFRNFCISCLLVEWNCYDALKHMSLRT